MRDFNKVNPKDTDPEYGYKDLTYYMKHYWIFGIFIVLYKEIFRK